MLSGIKYFLRGCLIDVVLVGLFVCWINSLQLNPCGQWLAFLRVEGCTFEYFAFYGAYFGTLMLLGTWWITFPLLAVAPAVGYLMDVGRMKAHAGDEATGD